MRTLPKKPFQKLTLTPHNEWSQKFWDTLIPLKDQVTQHKFFRQVQESKLDEIGRERGLVDFYPLVENFPKFMGLNLAKTQRGIPGHREAKYWLIQNIKVEQNHADWWHYWANGFGYTDEQLVQSKPSAKMDAINNFLWDINVSGSLEEGIAATNLAVEWATGEWTINILEGVKGYAKAGVAEINERVMSWLNAHATYDDEHPYEAMELLKLICKTPEQQKKALVAAQRSLEYYVMALDYCLESKGALVAA